MKTIENTSDPRYHSKNIKRMLQEVIDHVREDVTVVDEPHARALFETTAEVLTGLKRAYEHFEAGTEAAWK